MSKFKLKNWRGGQITEDVRQGVGRALFKGASHILNESNNIAPKDEGTLIQTSGVDVDVDEGKASVYYTQKYAVRLHEHPEYKFQGGRQGKFLEQAVTSEGKKVQKMIAEEIKDVLK
jgi:hypothetical protein